MWMEPNKKNFIPHPCLWYKRKFILLGNKLGFSIGENCFGYGLVLHHPGTIVVGANNRIGNFALVNTSTCIVKNNSFIGDGLYMWSGAKIISNVVMGNNTQIGANAVVNKSFEGGNILIAGIPGKEMKKVEKGWWETLYGEQWKKRHDEVVRLRIKMLG